MNQQEIFNQHLKSKSSYDQLTMLSNVSNETRARLLMQPTRVSGFVETAGAFFRQTNTVKNFATGLWDRDYLPDPNYNPTEDVDIEENAWIYKRWDHI